MAKGGARTWAFLHTLEEGWASLRSFVRHDGKH